MEIRITRSRRSVARTQSGRAEGLDDRAGLGVGGEVRLDAELLRGHVERRAERGDRREEAEAHVTLLDAHLEQRGLEAWRRQARVLAREGSSAARPPPPRQLTRVSFEVFRLQVRIGACLPARRASPPWIDEPRRARGLLSARPAANDARLLPCDEAGILERPSTRGHGHGGGMSTEREHGTRARNASTEREHGTRRSYCSRA